MKKALRNFVLVALAAITTWTMAGLANAEEAQPVPVKFGLDLPPLEAPKAIDTSTYQNRAVDAYVQALKEGKYTVVVISHHHDINPFAKRMVRNLSDPKLAKYANEIVMCLTDPEVDDGGKDLREAFQTNAYPALYVLRTDRRQLHIVGQMVGECEVEQIDRFLAKVLPLPADFAQNK